MKHTQKNRSEHGSTKVECLQNHVPIVESHYADVCLWVEKAASQIDAEALMNFINSTKEALKEVDVDLKDAKRRLSASKPKKAKPAIRDEDSASGSESSAEEKD